MADLLVLVGTGATMAAVGLGRWLIHWLRHRYGMW